MNAVEKHPQKQKIIDMMLDGATLTAISAKFADPPLHISQLSRFKTKLLAPAIKAMNPRSASVREIKTLATKPGINVGATLISNAHSDEPLVAARQDSLRANLEQRVEKRIMRREGWIAAAESQTIVDKEGNTYVAMDHRALASHDGNEGKDIETLAKLGNLYADGNTTNVMIAFMSAGIDGAPAQVIEGQVESVEEGELRR